MKKSIGFTLVEVLVFVTILSLFFISAVTITTFSLRSLKIQEHKIIATRYAEEASEWLRQEKEDDWQIFASHNGDYCLNTNPISWTSNSCSGYDLGTPGFFKRDLTISGSGNPVDKITTVLTVSWLENGLPQNVILKSVYNLWE
jgi:type II secretory pathway pseudopilin PulG